MQFIIYNKSSGVISQIRVEDSTGEPTPLSVWLERHCKLCGLTLNDFDIVEIQDIPISVVPNQYKYVASTQQFEEDPNYVPPPPPPPPPPIEPPTQPNQ